MFCGLREEKLKLLDLEKKKKEKKLIAAKSGLVRMKGYLKTFNHVKYIFWRTLAIFK